VVLQIRSCAGSCNITEGFEIERLAGLVVACCEYDSEGTVNLYNRTLLHRMYEYERLFHFILYLIAWLVC
jgi:hypothetical protein